MSGLTPPCLDSSQPPKWLVSVATTRLVFLLLFHTHYQLPSSPVPSLPETKAQTISTVRTKRTSMGPRACQFTRHKYSRAWVVSTTVLALEILLAATLVR